MEPSHLRTLVVVADEGSFGRASARLNLSQPAVSRQILALERDLGVRLFDRTSRPARLTSEGEDLVRRARTILTDLEAFGERARALKAGTRGIVRVGATPQVIETFLADFVVHHRRRHPGVEVRIVEDGGARLPARLERGDTHLALMLAGDARFEWRVLAPLCLLAVFPRSYRAPRRATIEIEALAGHPLLVPRREFGSREWLDAACAAAHIRPRILLESGAPSALIALARSGYGIAIVPSNADVPTDGVRALPIVQRGAAIGGWASIAWDPRRFLAPYAEQFIDELTRYARRAYPGRRFTRRAPHLAPPPRTAGRSSSA